MIENKNFNINKNCTENNIYNFMVNKKYILISKTPLDSFFIDPMKSYFKWIPENMKIWKYKISYGLNNYSLKD